MTTGRARVVKNEETLFENVWKMSDQLQLELAILIRFIDRFDLYLNPGTDVGTDVGD